jgi:methylthioribose-1-phosphate isomerase
VSRFLAKRQSIMNIALTPLFEPVLWEGSGFKILDETLVPERIEYIAVREISQALGAVKEMRTRAFGQVLTFLYSGALLAERYDGKEPELLRERIEEMTQQFCAARPTFDFKGLSRFFFKALGELPSAVNAGDWIATQARGFAAQIVKSRQARAQRAASILPNPARVLTHCNISGELVAIAQYCQETGKEISVIATETRPYLQGTRLTAWELCNASVPVSLIPDCAIAQVMARGDVNAVIVGSDRCAQNGDIINKVGTYPLALMAREHGIPFFSLVQDPGPLTRGDEVTIEERPAHELLTFQEQPLIVDGGNKLAGRYPAFDVTPSSLISNLIGFDDLFTPESFRERYLKGTLPAAGSKEDLAEKYLLVYGVPKKDSYSFLAHALKAEQADRILVPEMRPELWGARTVAPELLRRDVPTTVISDNTMGTLFAHGQIRQLYLFYIGLGETGPSGICGSLLAARLAHAHGVPIELLESDSSKESLTDRDVSTFLGKEIIPPGVTIYPLEKEIISWALLKAKQGAQL